MKPEPMRPHVAGIVHTNGSQFCRQCGLLLRVPDAVREPVTPGTKVARLQPCQAPAWLAHGRKVDSPSGE